MRGNMICHQTLHEHRKGAGGSESPHDSEAVNAGSHDEVTESKFVEDIAEQWGVFNDWEGRAIVGTKNFGSITSFRHKCFQGAERTVPGTPLRFNNVSSLRFLHYI